MIIFRSKQIEFSDDSRKDEITYLINCCFTITREVIKAIEMYYLDYQDVNHWLDKATSYMLRFTNKDYIDVYMSFICMLDINSIRNLVGIDGLEYLKQKYKLQGNNLNIDFLENIKSSIRKDYNKIEKENKVILFNSTNNNYYINAFKFITLCFSGEVKPHDWKNTNSWIKKSIPNPSNINLVSKGLNFEKNKESSDKIHSLLLSCIENILYVK